MGQELAPARVAAYHVLNGVAEVSPSDVLAAGVGGPPGGQGRVWAWDGERWSSTQAPCPDSCGFAAITRISSDDAWAVGDDHAGALPVAMHYDGKGWTRAKLPTPAPDSADRLESVSASGPDDVWAAGYTVTGFERVTTPLIEHYDGHRWRKVHAGKSIEWAQLYDIVSIGPDDVWAVGGSPMALIVEHWDGHRWSQELNGIQEPTDANMSVLQSITALGPDDVWVAGERYLSRSQHHDGVRFHAVVFHWDGSRWTRMPMPALSRPHSWLYGIAARSDDDVWVVGGVGGGMDYIGRRTLTEHYDGHSWTHVPSPNRGDFVNMLNGVTIGPDGDAWAVGETSDDERHYHDIALHWDGKHWVNQPIRPHG